MSIGIEDYNYATGDCSGITANTPKHGHVLCVGGKAVYPSPSHFLIMKSTKKGREKIEVNRCICLKKKEAKIPSEQIPSGSLVDDGTLDTRTTDNNSTTNVDSPKKISTSMIIGLSIGGLVLIGGIIYLVKRNKAKK